MSEYEDWLKGEIEKSRKSGLTFVLCGIGLLIVMIIMIIMFKHALPVTFMSIICIFNVAAGTEKVLSKTARRFCKKPVEGVLSKI